MESKGGYFSAKLPSDIRDWIKELAIKNRRSLNSELIMILEEVRRKQEDEAEHA